MKEHAKKALKHDVEILGKTVPTIAVVALFLIGSGSAALLANFGTITGEADVDQAIELESESNYNFDGAQTAGETVIETRKLQSNANVTTEIGFDTTCSNGSESNSKTGVDLDWSSSSGCTGVDTRYVEYFDDAGADFSSYDAGVTLSGADWYVDDDSGNNVDFSSPAEALNDGSVSDGDTVLVAPGDYDSFTVDKDVTVVSEVAPDATETASVNGSNGNDGTATGTAIVVSADGATVKGFEVVEAIDSGTDSRGIDVYAKNVKIAYNSIHDVKSEEHAIGIFLFGKSSNGYDVSNAEVSNNRIYDIVAYDPDQDSRTVGVTLTGTASDVADGVVIKQNSITDLGNMSSVMTQGVEVNGGHPQGFQIDSNYFSEINFNPDRHTPLAAGVYVTGYDAQNHPSGNTTPNPYGGAAINKNVFNLSEDTATVGVKLWDSYHEGHLNAENNWWDTDGIEYAVHDVVNPTDSRKNGVDASWKEKSDLAVDANSDDKFGVINEFAINLAPADYSLTTTITPAGAEETPS